MISRRERVRSGIRVLGGVPCQRLGASGISTAFILKTVIIFLAKSREAWDRYFVLVIKF